MFFYLSKILMFLISPLVWIFSLLAYGLITKNKTRKKWLLILSAVFFYIFSNAFIVDELFRWWEVPAIKQEAITKPYDYGILLGGMISYDVQFKRINFSHSTDRLLQTIELYHLKKIKKIVISSGSGSILNQNEKEATLLKEYLVNTGIPEGDIISEAESKNTRENAINTAELLKDSLNGKNCLLITSAFHMKRALGCFQKAGIAVDPYSTDRYSGRRKFVLDHLLIPNSGALVQWSLFIHETIGYLTYKLMGYL